MTGFRYVLGGNKNEQDRIDRNTRSRVEKAELSKKDAEKAVKAFTDVVAEELVKARRSS